MTTKQKNITTALIALIALLALLALLLISVSAQQPKPVDKRLSPEASKAWLDIEAAKAELRKQYGFLESQQAAIAIGAEVPQSDREHWINDKGVIVFVHQEAAMASPEKK